MPQNWISPIGGLPKSQINSRPKTPKPQNLKMSSSPISISPMVENPRKRKLSEAEADNKEKISDSELGIMDFPFEDQQFYPFSMNKRQPRAPIPFYEQPVEPCVVCENPLFTLVSSDPKEYVPDFSSYVIERAQEEVRRKVPTGPDCYRKPAVVPCCCQKNVICGNCYFQDEDASECAICKTEFCESGNHFVTLAKVVLREQEKKKTADEIMWKARLAESAAREAYRLSPVVEVEEEKKPLTEEEELALLMKEDAYQKKK